MELKLLTVSALEKVFPDEELKLQAFNKMSVLRGETASFQVAYRCDELACAVEFSCQSDLKNKVEVRETALVSCEYPSPAGEDDKNYLRMTPGLYPDPLRAYSRKLNSPPFQWRTMWITVPVDADEQVGRHELKIAAKVHQWSKEVATESITFELEVLSVELPEQTLLHTEWFHADCIYSFYGVECWSEAHWNLLSKYFKNFADHGTNMVLTPLWTPPLDTKVGGERPTVQLLGIEKVNGNFIFNFDSLGRWIDLALENGIKYFEMAHPFTQCGAEFCPKGEVKENGELVKMFGWHTVAMSDEYKVFLKQLFPQLLAFLDSKGVKDKCYYHVSDEPHQKHMENYSKCAELIRSLVDGAPIIDALSNVEFYENGLVENPIPANNHIEPFIEAGVEPLWTYYCVSQKDKVPNRFFNFPSARNRIMGVLMYKYGISGFLHWGYNFWHSQFSLQHDLDPFKVTDAGRGFPSGDSFLVYPGKDGPVDSIRNEVQRDALQDLRALQLLEKLQGRKATLEMLHEGLTYELSMTEYPQDDSWLLNKRERVNRKIVKLS
ncbi:MAG: DUF4091 domain-containing protein [Lentisphaerae bacterium]|nr:DUF4091 domain-containing protein [Lentisphaerota bacterium]MCP4103783.1 DUF4091 domain-containing protein [Lentisphaerota bacterium]